MSPLGYFFICNLFVTGYVLSIVAGYKFFATLESMARRIRLWDGSRLEVPRWVLTAVYLPVIVVGLFVWLASSPTFDLTVPEGFQAFWGIALSATALVATISSIRERFEVVERWAVMIMSSLLIGFACAPLQLVFGGDWDRATYSTIAIALSVIPTYRATSLIIRTGRRRG